MMKVVVVRDTLIGKVTKELDAPVILHLFRNGGIELVGSSKDGEQLWYVFMKYISEVVITKDGEEVVTTKGGESETS